MAPQRKGLGGLSTGTHSAFPDHSTEGAVSPLSWLQTATHRRSVGASCHLRPEGESGPERFKRLIHRSTGQGHRSRPVCVRPWFYSQPPLQEKKTHNSLETWVKALPNPPGMALRQLGGAGTAVPCTLGSHPAPSPHLPSGREWEERAFHKESTVLIPRTLSASVTSQCKT